MGMEELEYQFLGDSLYTVDIMQKLIPDSIEMEEFNFDGIDLGDFRYVMNWQEI